MDQDRLGKLESRVNHLEEGNGWHEWGKYVLKKLDELGKDNKEHRKELCGKIDGLEEQNTLAHRELHRKLDTQGQMYANRPVECAKNFVQGRTIHWLIVIMALVIGGMFTVGISHITAVEKHIVKAPIEKTIEIDKPELTVE